MSDTNRWLVLGDILAIALVTLIGFATHGEVGAGSPGPYIVLPRMLAAFLPLTVAWFLLAPRLGLFHKEVVSDSRQIWRPAFAMIFAAPFAAVLRGLLLDAPLAPIFAVVLSLTSAIGMMVWRGSFILLSRDRRR